MNVKDRLKKYLEFKDIGQTKFADSIGVSSGYVNAIRKSIQPDKILKIKEAYPDLNIDWLLYGSEPMIYNNAIIDNENFEVYQPQIEALTKTHIPYYNVDFAGGWSSEEMFLDVRPDFYINNPEFDRSDFACNLRGKSVSKIIPDGAVVGFKIIEDWQTYFPQNELYGIITKNDFRTVKLIGKTKDGKSLILKPQPSEQYLDRYKDQEEILPIEFVTKFLQVIAYACYERLVI